VLAPGCGGDRLPARLLGRTPGRTAEPCAVPALGHLRGRPDHGRRSPPLIRPLPQIFDIVWPLLSLLWMDGSQTLRASVISHTWTHALSFLAVRIA
jgi:hypothetical protein